MKLTTIALIFCAFVVSTSFADQCDDAFNGADKYLADLHLKFFSGRVLEVFDHLKDIKNQHDTIRQNCKDIEPIREEAPFAVGSNCKVLHSMLTELLQNYEWEKFRTNEVKNDVLVSLTQIIKMVPTGNIDECLEDWTKRFNKIRYQIDDDNFLAPLTDEDDSDSGVIDIASIENEDEDGDDWVSIDKEVGHLGEEHEHKGEEVVIGHKDIDDKDINIFMTNVFNEEEMLSEKDTKDSKKDNGEDINELDFYLNELEEDLMELLNKLADNGELDIASLFGEEKGEDVDIDALIKAFGGLDEDSDEEEKKKVSKDVLVDIGKVKDNGEFVVNAEDLIVAVFDDDQVPINNKIQVIEKQVDNEPGKVETPTRPNVVGGEAAWPFSGDD